MREIHYSWIGILDFSTSSSQSQPNSTVKFSQIYQDDPGTFYVVDILLQLRKLSDCISKIKRLVTSWKNILSYIHNMLEAVPTSKKRQKGELRMVKANKEVSHWKESHHDQHVYIQACTCGLCHWRAVNRHLHKAWPTFHVAKMTMSDNAKCWLGYEKCKSHPCRNPE